MSKTPKYEEEGIVRVEIDLDFKTYAFLLAIVKKSGYKVGQAHRQKSEGIRGVLTQSILELYQKYIEQEKTNEEGEHSGLDKINQQAYIFASHTQAMKINGIPDEKIVSTLQSKLPSYLKEYKEGKLVSKGALNTFVAASTFPNPKLPVLTPVMKKEFERKGIYKYVNQLSQKS
jgi:hypothetical protein